MPARRRHPRRAVTALAAGLAAGLAALPALGVLPGASASTGSSGSTGLTGQRGGAVTYVAMGDSYSAASGVLPVDVTVPQCARSLANYPHVVAGRTGFALTDVTCGAAETKDFSESQYPGVAPQLRALSDAADLVTMTIGGNDGGVFIQSILRCGAEGVLTLGQGSPCKDRYGNRFVRTIREETFPDLVRALRKVHRRAPNAEVAILGYPWILPKRVGCFDKMPVARGDVPYLRNLQWVLNDAVRRAADRTGTTYVGFNRVSNGHDACRPIGERWIEPVLQGTNPVVVHPNALGERRMATRTMRVLDLG